MPGMRSRVRNPLAVVLGIIILTATSCSASGRRAARGAGSDPLVPSIARSSGSVSVFPEPGSKTALPATQVSFRGIRSGALGTILVTGSRSGVHLGRIESQSDGDGASFLPTAPFTAGETVTVRTSLPIRGGDAGTVRFSIATPAKETVVITPSPSSSSKATTSKAAPSPTRPSPAASSPAPAATTFVSAPSLHAPTVSVTDDGRDADHHDVLLSTKGGGFEAAAQIVDDHGNLVWYHPIGGGTAVNGLAMQQYRGEPVLTWWQGVQNTAHGYGNGEDVVVNSSYQPVATVTAADGLAADLHDFRLTAHGTALITAYSSIRWDLRPVGGPRDGIVLDGVVQEIDIKTGLVMDEWHALDHVPLSASQVSPPKTDTTAWDFFHVNSIDPGTGETMLISARHTSAVYDVDRSTGDLLWTMGGNDSDFTVAKDAVFGFQHDARWLPDGDITVFDDGGGPPRTEPQSRALRLRVDMATHDVSLVSADTHTSSPVVTNSQGNVQQLPDGDSFVGWGSVPRATEFTSSGAVSWDATFPPGVTSYRAYRAAWVGRPATAPALAVTSSGGRETAFVSWNGDTRTTSWRLLGVGSRDRPSVATRTGFQTSLAVPAGAHAVRVEALDADGHVLATASAPVPR